MYRFVVAICLLWTAAAMAEARGPAVPDYPADQVAPHTYVIHGPVGYPTPQNQGFMNNPAFVVTAAGVVVVDPGSSVQTGEMVLRQIRGVTDRPLAAVLNTHVHGDHWLGNHALRAAYPDVPIYAHPRMLERVAKGAGEEWIGRMLSATENATRGTAPVGPTIAIGDGDELTVGEVTFRFHHPGAAHTDNDLMIEVAGEGVLFLADNANNRRIVRMDDGTFRGSVAVLDAALAIPAQVWIPGHGHTGDAAFVRDYRDYLDALYRAVEAFYGEGMTDFEMKPRVAERLARFADWPGFEDELGKHISLAVLEVEAAAFE
jgi:glyoxylase-like metal-dependent hydrolase (beta-lactamase superfamily II)